MNCPNHYANEVTGYCSVCGAFGCPECLTLHEGSLYCPKHYRPIQQQLEEARKHAEQRRKHDRQRLVVRFRDGRTVRGTCYALNLRDTGFHLDKVNEEGVTSGETEHVLFNTIKAVYYVKTFDGKFERGRRYRDFTPEGPDLVVKFHDNEVVRGRPLHKAGHLEPRYHLIPHDADTNNLCILVEATSVQATYTIEEYRQKLAEEKATRKEMTGGDTALSQEETLGDFYFETRNYDAALAQYKIAMEKTPGNARLMKKMVMARYNCGVQFIKKRDYPSAYACMQEVLKFDPTNLHAKKKALQLKKIMQKPEPGAQRPMGNA
jgi:tetratricopeptide (TPR) repeat protein